MPEERRLVTVLFADVTGSTALGEDLDPEDVRALMGRYYDHARRVVSEHGGTLEKFIGDAVMAVFGLPRALGDDAERAVAAGLSLRQAVSDDAALPEVVLRIGVNTGEVVATSDPAAADFLVTGDAVNVAARLQQAAVPGEILVSERTYTATRAAFHFGSSQGVAVKGKREPLRVFPIIGKREHRQTVRPPLVGREDDLTILALLQRRVMREGRPQLISIVAPAGTGKTRLIEEFLARPDSAGVRTATSRCPPYGQTLTYWPLRGLMEGLLGGVDRQMVVEAFEAAGYADDDATHLADRVFSTLGREGETLTERDSIFGAWRLFVEALAKHGPLIIVFEDLHWASDSLLDLVEQIMQPRTRAPLLVIAVSRPELLDRRPAWGGGSRQNVTILALEPLGEEQTAQLVQGLDPTLPGPILRRVVERSAGNPFFVAELVRGLAERDPLKGSGELVDVPDTVHAALLARLDLLEPTTRQVLQAAAVGGRLLRPTMVQAILNDLGPEELDAAIDNLLVRELIVPEAGDAFTFSHALIREVAYGTLSRAERARMHAAVARWLEDFAQGHYDAYVELIAYHYREAIVLGRRTGAIATAELDAERAVAALERSGELAGRAGARSEARRSLEGAIAVAEEGDRGRLYEKLGDALVRGDAAADAYGEALERWRQAGASDPAVGARLLRKLMLAYLRWGAVTTPTLELLSELHEEAGRLAEYAGQDEQWRFTAIDVFFSNAKHFMEGENPTDFGEELELLRDRALAAAAYFEERGEWEAHSVALDASMSCSRYLGRWDDVLASARRRLAAPELSVSERGDALQMAGWACWSRNDWKGALEVAQEAIASIRPGEPITHLQSVLGHGMGGAYFCGRWDEVLAMVPVIEEIRAQLEGEPADLWFINAYLRWLTVAVAREDEAAADFAIAVLRDLSPQAHLDQMVPVAEAIRADDVSLLDRNYDASGYPIINVLWILNERGVPAPDALLAAAERSSFRASELFAWLLAVTRAIRDRDAQQLAAGIQAAEAQEAITDAARLRIVLAGIACDPAPLEEARPVLEQLGDRQFLRRLQAVRVSLGEGRGDGY